MFKKFLGFAYNVSRVSKIVAVQAFPLVRSYSLQNDSYIRNYTLINNIRFKSDKSSGGKKDGNDKCNGNGKDNDNDKKECEDLECGGDGIKVMYKNLGLELPKPTPKSLKKDDCVDRTSEKTNSKKAHIKKCEPPSSMKVAKEGPLAKSIAQNKIKADAKGKPLQQVFIFLDGKMVPKLLGGKESDAKSQNKSKETKKSAKAGEKSKVKKSDPCTDKKEEKKAEKKTDPCTDKKEEKKAEKKTDPCTDKKEEKKAEKKTDPCTDKKEEKKAEKKSDFCAEMKQRRPKVVKKEEQKSATCPDWQDVRSLQKAGAKSVAATAVKPEATKTAAPAAAKPKESSTAKPTEATKTAAPAAVKPKESATAKPTEAAKTTATKPIEKPKEAAKATAEKSTTDAKPTDKESPCESKPDSEFVTKIPAAPCAKEQAEALCSEAQATRRNITCLDPPHYLPCDIFRKLPDSKEKLGPNAGKARAYKNSEFFAYHKYSYTNIQMAILELKEKNKKKKENKKSDKKTEK